MEIEIKTCIDCPFLSDTHSCCELRPKIEKRDTEPEDYVPYRFSEGYVTPEWCPLRNESVLLKKI